MSEHVPSDVYGFADSRLDARVRESFNGELDVEVLKTRAYLKAQTVVHKLPVLEGDAESGDRGWLIELLIGAFGIRGILAMPMDQLEALMLQLLKTLDLEDLSKQMLSGPMILLLGGAFMNTSLALLSPLERVLRSRFAHFGAGAGFTIPGVEDILGSNTIQYRWKVALAGAARRLRGRRVLVDKAWADIRRRVVLDNKLDHSLDTAVVEQLKGLSESSIPERKDTVKYEG